MDPDDGLPWDLSSPVKVARLEKLIRAYEPFLVIVSPPCTPSSTLANRNPTRGKEKARGEPEKAMTPIRTCMGVYQAHVAGGRCFMHEHPTSASAWPMPEVSAVVDLAWVQVMAIGLYQLGTVATGDDGKMKPVQKPTRTLANTAEIAKRVHRKCQS